MRNCLLMLTAISAIVFFLFCCSDEESEVVASILDTNPPDGGAMFIEEELVITFDKDVASVKINGNVANVNGDTASWKLNGISAGEQSFLIEWTDADGGSGFHEINLTVMNLDGTVCFLPEDIIRFHKEYYL